MQLLTSRQVSSRCHCKLSTHLSNRNRGRKNTCPRCPRFTCCLPTIFLSFAYFSVLLRFTRLEAILTFRGSQPQHQRHCEIWLLQKSWDDPSPCLRRSRPARLVFFHPAQLVLSPARRGGGACGKVSWCSGSCGKACRVEKLASVQGSNTVVLQ